ncbi:hypothetical protein GUI43_03273 [Micromonospora noduli]|nr:hypothetical protein GUI43_03273 [Micromonospora noduli]
MVGCGGHRRPVRAVDVVGGESPFGAARVALEVHLGHPHLARRVEHQVRHAVQAQRRRVRMAVAEDHVLHAALRAGGLADVHADGPVQGVVRGAEGPTVFVPDPAHPAEHVLEHPPLALLGAPRPHSRAVHGGGRVGDVPAQRVVPVRGPAGQVSPGAYAEPLAGAPVGLRVDGPAEAVEVDHGGRVGVSGGEPRGAGGRVGRFRVGHGWAAPFGVPLAVEHRVVGVEQPVRPGSGLDPAEGAVRIAGQDGPAQRVVVADRCGTDLAQRRRVLVLVGGAEVGLVPLHRVALVVDHRAAGADPARVGVHLDGQPVLTHLQGPARMHPRLGDRHPTGAGAVLVALQPARVGRAVPFPVPAPAVRGLTVDQPVERVVGERQRRIVERVAVPGAGPAEQRRGHHPAQLVVAHRAALPVRVGDEARAEHQVVVDSGGDRPGRLVDGHPLGEQVVGVEGDRRRHAQRVPGPVGQVEVRGRIGGIAHLAGGDPPVRAAVEVHVAGGGQVRVGHRRAVAGGQRGRGERELVRLVPQPQAVPLPGRQRRQRVVPEPYL